MYQQSKGDKTVASTFQVESACIKVSVDKLWESIKSFEFEKVFPTVVKSVKFTSGSPSEVGSVFQIEFKDGTSFEKRIVEISEIKRRLVWEIISSTSETSFS